MTFRISLVAVVLFAVSLSAVSLSAGPRDRHGGRWHNGAGDGTAAAQWEPLPDMEIVSALSIQNVEVEGNIVSFSVHVDTSAEGTNFDELSFGVSTLQPGVLSVHDAVPGPALMTYVALNGEPPTCDIVIYPGRQAAVGSITKLLEGLEFDSNAYGTEFLRLSYEVQNEGAEDVALQLFTSQEMTSNRDDQLVVVRSELNAVRVQLAPPRIVKGDANGDAEVKIGDAMHTINHLFRGRQMHCALAADVDGDGTLAINDAILTLSSLFGGDAPLPENCERFEGESGELDCQRSYCRR